MHKPPQKGSSCAVPRCRAAIDGGRPASGTARRGFLEKEANRLGVSIQKTSLEL